MTVLIVIKPHLQAIRINEPGDRRDRHHDCSDRHHADPTYRQFVLNNLVIVVIAIMTIVISIRPHLQQAICIKNLAIVVIAIMTVVIVIRPHLQAFLI